MSTILTARQKPHTSYSQGLGFIKCGKAHYLKRVVKVPQMPSLASVAGRAAHGLVEEWDRLGCPDWDYTEWAIEAQTTLDGEISKTENESGIPLSGWRISGRRSKEWPDKENADWWMTKLPGMGVMYADWRRDHPDWEIWITPDGEEAIELELSVDIPGVDVPFLCYIDRVFVGPEGSLVIFDFKFGSRMPEDLFQLASYAMALELQHGVRAEFGAIYNGRLGKLVPLFKDEQVLMSLAHLPTSVVAGTIAQSHGLMSAGYYPANPGNHCGWCDVRNSCVWAKGRDAWKHDPLHPAYQGSMALAA